MVDTETGGTHDIVVPYSRRLKYAYGLAMSPDGRFVYSAGTSRDIWHRFDTVSGLVCGGATIHNGTSGCLCRDVGEGFSDVVNEESPVEYFERPSKKPQCPISNDYVYAMALSPNGEFLATVGVDCLEGVGNDIIIWNTKTAAIEHVLRNTGASSFAFNAGASSLAFSPDGARIASGHRHPTVLYGDAEVRIWDIVSGESTHTFSWKYTENITDLCFSPVNSAILAIVSEKPMRQVDLDNMQQPPIQFDGHSFCRYSPGGNVVATTGMHDLGKRDIQLFDTVSGILLSTKRVAHRDFVKDLCWSPDGSKFASCCFGDCKVWDSSTFTLLHTIDEVYRIGNHVRLSWGPNWGLETERRLAYAMSTHKRIGDDSGMGILSEELLRMIAYGPR
jgi:WD domain, G-beta repeat